MGETHRTLPDISDERKEELYLYSLKKMAEVNVESNIDHLTQLLNLRAFQYESGELMRSNPDKRFALIVLDIDNFKSLNEFCGRDTGDALLIHIADTLRKYQNEYVRLSHFRADTFGILTPFVQRDELVAMVDSISSEIDAFRIPYKVLPAFGICTADDPDTPVSLMRDYATLAMRSIKGKFYAKYAFFDIDMRRQILHEKQIENDIVEALASRQLQAFIQPKIDMTTGMIVGGEALVRWLHPTHGLIAPGEFIPVLEKSGLIIDVDICVWTQIFRWLSERQGKQLRNVPISINISRMHAFDGNFQETLSKLASDYNVQPDLVPLELTESCFLQNAEKMYASIRELKKYGFILSMDDFGVGYSSLGMLRTQPVDEIKLDKSFIDDIDNTAGQLIVFSMVQLIHNLGKSVIVEGVETRKQRDFLVEHGCRKAQGFLYYKPMPITNFERLLR